MLQDDILEIAQKAYAYLAPFCIAIYLGGSRCKKYIRNPHDVDFICFADAPVDMCDIRRRLYFFLKKEQPAYFYEFHFDFIQVRTKQREEKAYGSYVNKQMIKLVGEDIKFNFDIIDKDRDEYIGILKNALNKLDTGRIRNQKRYYQLLEGYYILQNCSYDLTEEQIENINILHDMKEEDLEKRQELIKQLIQDINNL